MTDFIRDHQPDASTRQRAKDAGIDLEHLRREDPMQYAMLNAKRAVMVPAVLMDQVGTHFYRLFPEHLVFNLPATADGQTALLVFPPLDKHEHEALGNALAGLTTEARYTQAFLYYRVVQDQRGERHELAFPFAPDAWPGIPGVMVGPFVSEGDADRWGDTHVMGQQGLVYDTVLYAGRWFVDVFVAEH